MDGAINFLLSVEHRCLRYVPSLSPFLPSLLLFSPVVFLQVVFGFPCIIPLSGVNSCRQAVDVILGEILTVRFLLVHGASKFRT